MTAIPLTDEQYAAIRARRDAYLNSHNHTGVFACCTAHASADDVPVLLAELDRRTVALEVVISQSAKALKKRDTHKQSAEIASAELETLRGGLREIGGDPTQVQILYAQLSLRGRQWKEAKAEVGRLRAELEQARAAIAAVLAIPIPDEDEMEYLDPEDYQRMDARGDTLAEVRNAIRNATRES